MELILVQNNHVSNLFLIKTRRYKALIKFYFTPFIIVFVYNNLYKTMENRVLFPTCLYLQKLKKFYMNDNIWFFLRTFIYKNSGLLTNNINKSYIFWMIYISHGVIFFKSKHLLTIFSSNTKLYSKHIKIAPVALQKKSLQKVILFILLIFFKHYLPYINNFRMSYGFFFINNEFNFYLFYNLYYFKVHNY